jgi:hypothetical protein
MSIEGELRDETIKLLKKIEEKMKGVESKDKRGDEFLRNIRAYVSDCSYFLEKGDLIRAFESVVWAWAWIEIGVKIGFLINHRSI